MPHIDFPISDLPLDTAVRVEHEHMAIVVTRTASGISAFVDVCPHAAWPLSGGLVENGVLSCDGHGWEFDLKDGRCQNAPAYCLTPVKFTTMGDFLRLEWKRNLANKPSLCSIGQQ